MWHARGLESNRQSAPDRGAESSAPRSTPLTLVSGAVAGDDLQCIAAAAAEALRGTVAIAIPALGDPVVCPSGTLTADQAGEIQSLAAAVIAGQEPAQTSLIADAVAVRIGDQAVGVVAAVADPAVREAPPERRAWLDAAAAAASVTALIRDRRRDEDSDSAGELLSELHAGAPADLPEFVSRARGLGLELAGGAVALCARRRDAANGLQAGEISREHGALLAELSPGRLLGLAPLGDDAPAEIAELLRGQGMDVAVSAPRRDPAGLHEAIREAELMLELGTAADVQLANQDDTYRLLIGVLLRDPEDLATLRARTISPLVEYDAQHDTDLLATLRAFLAHDGSTTETAEAMNLHRHTVGYRLSRVHEVSGLSPYESDGRERLSLGLKADQILGAEQRRVEAACVMKGGGAVSADGAADGPGDRSGGTSGSGGPSPT